MYRILMITALKKYKQVLEGWKNLKKGIYGDQWDLGETKDFTIERFWNFSKNEFNVVSGDA